MTFIYIIAIILQAGIIIYFLRKNKNKPAPQQAARHIDTSTYECVRAAALSVTPADLQLQIPSGQLFVYGVVMDWDMGGSLLTLAAYITGAANVYLSTGPGITGAGNKPEVGELAVKFVSDAQHFTGRAIKVAVADNPAPGCVRFHLLTSNGMYDAQELLMHMEDTTSPWLSLFVRGNTLINEIKQG